MFRDRTDAGRQLADLLDDDVEADVVLAIPRGGLPVARPVADELGASLDVVVAAKMGAPRNAELALGAVASDGSAWLNERLIGDLNVSREYVRREREQQAAAAREMAERYRRGRDPVALTGERVVVVDDGVATGATARACLHQVREAGARHVTFAVPVGSPETLESLYSEADVVTAVESPPHFRAVGQCYERFDQVSDEVALRYLGASRQTDT